MDDPVVVLRRPRNKVSQVCAAGVPDCHEAQTGGGLSTVGKVSTDRQSKKFSSTDDRFLWTVGICALNSLSTAGSVATI